MGRTADSLLAGNARAAASDLRKLRPHLELAVLTKTYDIVVVDDDSAIRLGLSSLLRSAGHRVRSFESAEEYLADTRAPPDCVVTDIQMPGMNGLELQDVIRVRWPGLPVLIITAFPEPEIRKLALAAGAKCFLSKPFEAAAIFKCLHEAVGGPSIE